MQKRENEKKREKREKTRIGAEVVCRHLLEGVWLGLGRPSSRCCQTQPQHLILVFSRFSRFFSFSCFCIYTRKHKENAQILVFLAFSFSRFFSFFSFLHGPSGHGLGLLSGPWPAPAGDRHHQLHRCGYAFPQQKTAKPCCATTSTSQGAWTNTAF